MWGNRRYRSVEEHDCQAWSPNQEWILRPLLTNPVNPAKPKQKPIPGNIPLTIPSRVVDQVLKERKKEREEYLESLAADEENSDSDSKSNEESFGAYTGPYKVRRRKDKQESEEKKPSPQKVTNRHKPPPRPNVLFKHPPHPSVVHNRAHQIPKPQVAYINGAYPVFQDEPVEDPVFPNFLMNHIYKPQPQSDNAEAPTESESEEDDFSPQRYEVTRRPPTIPLPTGHPNYVAPKPKYGKLVVPQSDVKGESAEDSGSDSQSTEQQNQDGESQNVSAESKENENPEQQDDAEKESVEDSKSEEVQDSEEKHPTQSPYIKNNYNFYTGFEGKVENPEEDKDEGSSQSTSVESEEKQEEEDEVIQPVYAQKQKQNELRMEPRESASNQGTVSNYNDEENKVNYDDENEEESSEEEEDDQGDDEEDDGDQEERKDDEEVDETEFGLSKEDKRKKVKPLDTTDNEKELMDEEDPYEDDPSGDVGSFMKLLFKGIASRMTNNIRQEEDMVNIFERRKLFSG